jgi:hypothetical protein
MITEERLIRPLEWEPQRAIEGPRVVERPPVQRPTSRPLPQREAPGLLWRLVLILLGFGIAVTGWLLILTVFFSFIGLPVFFFGLALMQSQEP